MVSETKICQNCKNQFTIEPDDFTFYEKIKAPPPTWCPRCRMMRKLITAHGRTLYKVKCSAPGHSEEIISKYSSGSGRKVYDYEYWLSDQWSPLDYGREYDFRKPFFEQFRELLFSVPWRNLNVINSVNCDYCPSATDSKNCYLVTGAYFSENCMYSNTPALSRDCVDSSILIFCDTLYESFSCIKCFNLKFATYCVECMDSSFLYDCRNCINCFGCVGLRNKRYHILNKPYSKREYEAEVAKMDLGNLEALEEAKRKFDSLVAVSPRKYMISKNAVNCGDNIENAKNCRFSFEIRDGAENCKYILLGGRRVKDSYDVFASGEQCELLYESSAIRCQNTLFSNGIYDSFNVQYSNTCRSSSNLFGCVGLTKKEYCILNRRYSKDEYDKLVPEIIAHMNEMPYVGQREIVYKYGEFFPPEFSPYAYNETLAQEYFPLSQEEAIRYQFGWIEASQKEYENAIDREQIALHIREVGDDVSLKVIRCAHRGACNHHCPGAFRVVREELKFYRRINVSIPRLCPNCRHSVRTEGKRLYELWPRQCMCEGINGRNADSKAVYKNAVSHFHGEAHCPNTFETSYAPERPEVVYCEECYNKEII